MSDGRHVFTIGGDPVPKARTAFAIGGIARVALAQKTKKWEGTAAAMLQEAWGSLPTIDTPHRIEVWAISSRPKLLMRKKDHDGLMLRTKKPDASNVLKSAEDALVKAGVIADDALFVTAMCHSLYTEKDGSPRVIILIEPVTEVPALP